MLSESTTNKTISARPSKIVAGLEVAKTLELLLAIAFGIETKVKYIFLLMTIGTTKYIYLSILLLWSLGY